eukprot:5998202-Pleurochrysis_carterae.AAC.1
MRICRLMQLGKASTVGVIRVAETVNERTHELFHGSVDVNCRNLSLHILQKVGADHFTELGHGGQLRLASLREEGWPEINAPILLRCGHPHVVVQCVIDRVHPLREDDE